MLKALTAPFQHTGVKFLATGGINDQNIDQYLEMDQVIAIGATGLRRAGAKAKVTTADRWHIGSCGKAMTATLIARLVAKRKLSWKATIGRAFPNLRKSMHPAYVDVTLTRASTAGKPSVKLLVVGAAG